MNNTVSEQDKLIADAIASGDMETYHRLTGSYYTISGEILGGNRLGRSIGIPTINQVPKEDRLLPPFGVYFSQVRLNGQNYYGVTNVGRKPTVNSGRQITIETHIYNFSADVYGACADVMLIHYSRPEIKFPDVDSLKIQMDQDLQNCLDYFHL